MRTIKVKCSNVNCQKDFNKPLNEFKRRLAKNSPMYCCRKCSAINNIKNMGNKRNIGHFPNTKYPPGNNFKYYIRNAKKRLQFEFNLDLEYLKEIWENQKGICPYSKVQLILNSHSIRHKDMRYNASLDRIDSSKGYVKGNVQFISASINYMKNIMSHSDCIEFLQQITNNLKNSSLDEDRTISSPNKVLDALG